MNFSLICREVFKFFNIQRFFNFFIFHEFHIAWEKYAIMQNNMYRKLHFKDLGDERGKLVVIEGSQDIPFDIKRVFYIYGSDQKVVRGQHANRESEFVLVNVAGTSKVMITNGIDKEIVELDKPMKAVYIPKMMWKEM